MENQRVSEWVQTMNKDTLQKIKNDISEICKDSSYTFDKESNEKEFDKCLVDTISDMIEKIVIQMGKELVSITSMFRDANNTIWVSLLTNTSIINNCIDLINITNTSILYYSNTFIAGINSNNNCEFNDNDNSIEMEFVSTSRENDKLNELKDKYLSKYNNFIKEVL